MRTPPMKSEMLSDRVTDSYVPFEESRPELAGGVRSRWVVVTALVVLVAIAIRLALSFRHALIPGMDAAYYPMQTQWLIEHGELQMPAMPLVFWLQAILAKVLAGLRGLTVTEAVSLSARLFDGCCPPLTAVPVMLLGYRWSNGRRSAVLLCAAAAVLTVMSPPIIRMAGDLQKNAMGMMWMAVCVWAMRESLTAPRRIGWWIFLAIVFVLAGLTHIGAFAVTGAILIGSLVAFAALGKQRSLSRENLVFAGFAITGAVVVTLLVAWLVPSQVQRISSLVNKVLGFSPETLVLTVVVYGSVAWLLRRLWQCGESVPRSDMAIAMGVAFGLAILSAPIFSGVWSSRFQLMTVVPVALLLALGAAKLQWDREPVWLQKVLLLVIGLLAVASPLTMQGPVLSESAAEELRQLKAKVANPETTLVVAPHGFEYWAGYLMKTRVLKESVPDDVSPYDQVLLLEPNEEATGRRQPPHRPSVGRNQGLGGTDFRRPNARSVDPRRGPRGDFDSRGGNGGPSPHRVIVPANAKLIYQSERFKLYELPL